MKPRFGLIRAKQFLMKDLYSFDVDLSAAKRTYDLIASSYERIFTEIGIETVRVEGSAGFMGGNLSHEFHFLAEIGEDRLFTCNSCDYLGNIEQSGEKCPKCASSGTFRTGIEV